MPIGLRNAPNTFYRAMYVILSSFKWQFRLVSLEYIVTFNKTPEQQIHHVRKVLSLLYNNGATLMLKKRSSFTDTIKYLDHVVRSTRLQLASHTTDAFLGLNNLTSRIALSSSLGLCNAIRGFVSSIAQVVSPLNQNLKKHQPKFFHCSITDNFFL